MKKIITIILILFSILLTSCSNNQDMFKVMKLNEHIKYNNITLTLQELHNYLDNYYSNNAEFPSNKKVLYDYICSDEELYCDWWNEGKEMFDNFLKELNSIKNEKGCEEWYKYEVWDINGLPYQSYRISLCLNKETDKILNWLWSEKNKNIKKWKSDASKWVKDFKWVAISSSWFDETSESLNSFILGWDVNNKVIDIKDDELKKIENNKEKTIQQFSNTKTLIIKDNNVFIKEEWKDNIVLTTRATWQKECNWNRKDSSITWVWWWKETFYSYNILQNSWKYWIVEKFSHRCWIWWICAGPWVNYYIIDLDTNSDELTKLPDDLLFSGFHCIVDNYNIKTIWDELYIQFDKPNELIWLDSGISFDDIKNNNFQKEEKLWSKKLNLNIFLWKKQIIKTNNNVINTWKYTHNNLINNWYKLNILWSINEYYKVISHDEVSEKDKDGIPMLISRWYTENNTIYIEWSKILDFSTHLSWWNWLTINYPKKEWNEFFEISEYSFRACQPIFWCKKEKIIINDLNTINFINLNKWINKNIWKRK